MYVIAEKYLKDAMGESGDLMIVGTLAPSGHRYLSLHNHDMISTMTNATDENMSTMALSSIPPSSIPSSPLHSPPPPPEAHPSPSFASFAHLDDTVDLAAPGIDVPFTAINPDTLMVPCASRAVKADERQQRWQALG